jgi:arylsulfatase A-like enzyme
MADDQGWGDVGYAGHPFLKTPNLDDMAASALRFDRFYAAAPVCSPTRGSVMTGRHPNRFGCFKWGHTLRPQEITLAEALKGVGYATGHFGKWHLGSVREESPVNPGASGFDEWLSAPNFFDDDPILSSGGVAVPTGGESSMVVMDAALKFIRSRTEARQPFLAVIWFGSPHLPHRAAENDRSLYSESGSADFFGEITGLDRAVGKLRETLVTLGIRGNTLLWYCSDNGGLPNLGSTGGRGHKGQVYEGGLRVPAILEWPARVPRPRVTSVPCSTSDIYPTLVDLTGARVKNQPPLDGISLLPLIQDRINVRSKPIGFWDYPAKGISTPSHQWMSELMEAQKAGREPGHRSRLRLDAALIRTQYPVDAFPGHAAWLDWPWKLHRIENGKGEVRVELYNLEEDAGETDNRAERNPERIRAMKPELEVWLASVVRSLNGKDYP